MYALLKTQLTNRAPHKSSRVTITSVLTPTIGVTVSWIVTMAPTKRRPVLPGYQKNQPLIQLLPNQPLLPGLHLQSGLLLLQIDLQVLSPLPPLLHPRVGIVGNGSLSCISSMMISTETNFLLNQNLPTTM